MKKVGILTRHVYPNYGSLLQGHALESAISSFAARCSIIDYFPPTDRPFRLASSRLRESRMRDSLAKRAAYLAVQTPNMASMSIRFRAFQREHLSLTTTCADPAAVAETIGSIDVAVTGSDQIWNSVHGQLDPVYFLSGQPSSKKFSYAASFGSGSPFETESEKIISWLQDYQSVSVREQSAQSALTAKGIECRVDVDPVLLHGKEYWNKFSSSQSHIDTKYILVYQLHNTPGFNQKLRLIAERHALPIRRVTPDAKMYLSSRASDFLVDPRRFVALFRDATAVVTDSFHGTAFSLLYGKPIYALLPEKNFARNLDLLSSVGLAHLTSSVHQEAPRDPSYDPAPVLRKLKDRADESWSYIREIATAGEPK